LIDNAFVMIDKLEKLLMLVEERLDELGDRDARD